LDWHIVSGTGNRLLYRFRIGAKEESLPRRKVFMSSLTTSMAVYGPSLAPTAGRDSNLCFSISLPLGVPSLAYLVLTIQAEILTGKFLEQGIGRLGLRVDRYLGRVKQDDGLGGLRPAFSQDWTKVW
jgi:hypothetical protein